MLFKSISYDEHSLLFAQFVVKKLKSSQTSVPHWVIQRFHWLHTSEFTIHYLLFDCFPCDLQFVHNFVILSPFDMKIKRIWILKKLIKMSRTF